MALIASKHHIIMIGKLNNTNFIVWKILKKTITVKCNILLDFRDIQIMIVRNLEMINEIWEYFHETL
jgi:hypothetical protein